MLLQFLHYNKIEVILIKRTVYTDIADFEIQNSELGTILALAKNTDILTHPIYVAGHKIENRLVCQAMEGCDGTSDGCPDTLTKRRYKRFATGGAGLIWFEATAVMEEGRANPRQLYINEKNLDAFKAEVEKIKETGLRENGFEPVIIMQATHSGRYSKPFGMPAPLIAYNNPIFEKDSPIPKECIVSDEYLDRVGEALVKGAVLAERAGFDGVDIKACHRYLNCELLSAYTREGRYGGDFENRTRLLVESVEGAVKACSKTFIVSTRLNAYDGFPYPYGFGIKDGTGLEFAPEEPIRLLKVLYEKGVRLVNITMGNPYFNPHVNRPFASGGYETKEHPLEGVARMLHGISVLKSAVPEMTLISSALSYLGVAAPRVAAGFIENGGFDLAGFGRTVFAYPDFARDIIATGEMKKEKICICCSKCTHIMRAGGTPGCVIRDREAYLPIYKKYFDK